ncbi:DNA alkylation repair protein [Niabella sp. CC-SYL272]|uniref:DNA alkylation repair protein n=1 Tax=Niabella agricola TaxID=2891571 RepID=UPI001F1EF84C|nr:DNA alkylation repair protein [Niabella agricola]MCF3108254.1 DNA alkylation repair protein [Niabella agricola]
MNEIKKRTGARSVKDIPPSILEQLNTGKIATVNLTEWLAVDQKLLFRNLLQQLDRANYIQPVMNAIGQLKRQTVNTINETIGSGLLTLIIKNKDHELRQLLSAHPADMVRCWAAYMIGNDPGPDTGQLLHQIRPFAADGHFGVREIAWMAVRPGITNNLKESIKILSEWVRDNDANVRRFASEATRPRGVWCAHITTLKQMPQQGLPILEPLMADCSRYVQDSVGNWLNDAGKTQPGFVTDLCNRWNTISPTKATTYITKKALRNIV